MSLLTVDESRCKKDGICSLECPAGLIRMNSKTGLPGMIRGGDQVCIRCGHCVVICPNDAMGHTEIPIEDCPPMQKSLSLDAEQAEYFLRSRRSIRVFKDTPVEKEKLQQLVEMARYAPTGHNTGAINWTVYTNPETVKNLVALTVDWMRDMAKDHPEMAKNLGMTKMIKDWENGHDSILRGAVNLIVAQSAKGAITGQQDCDIALSYFELAAVSLGIGTCWAGLLTMASRSYEPLKEAMGLEEKGYYYAMMVGYPKYKYHRLAVRKAPNIIWK